MALTKVSTDGVKDDAITKTKIPANQIEASELADNAVDTNAIADDAVTNAKLADNAVQGAIIASGGIGSGKLAANSVSNTNIIDGNVTSSELGTNAVTTAKIADGNVTAGKLASGVQTTINNNADNRVITGSGTANTLEGEAGLTYTGQALNVNSVTSEGNAFRIYNTTDNSTRFHINGEGDYFTGNSYPRSDANMDLGFRSGYRWRDLILSGGVQLGGTGTANLLDDYEEGTWTPTITYESADSGNKTYVHQYGVYTKIGRVVIASIHLEISNRGTGSGSIEFSLPFACASILTNTALEAGGHFYYFTGFTSSVSFLSLTALDGLARARMYGVAGTQNTSMSNITRDYIGNNFNIRARITYFTS